MNCEKFESRIHDLLDRRCPLDSDESLEKHAAVCGTCRSLLDTYLDLAHGLELFETPPLADDLPQRVVGEVVVQRRRSRRRFVAAAMVALAAGLLLALIPALWSDNAPVGTELTHIAAEAGQPQAPNEVDPDQPGEVSPSLEPEKFEQSITSFTPEQLRGLWNELSANLMLENGRLESSVGLAGGLRPITTSLSAAIEVLRSTIPLGRSPRWDADSARVLLSEPVPGQAA